MFFTITFIFYLQKIVKNILYYNMYSGYDERFIVNKTDNKKQLMVIQENFEKKYILEQLKNDNISTVIKLLLLNDYYNPINLHFRNLEW